VERTHPVMEEVSAVFASFTPSANEAQTEQNLVRPVLKLLGHDFEVQPALATPDGTKRPDYVCYRDATSLDANKTVPQRGSWPTASARWCVLPLVTPNISVQKYPSAKGRSPEGPRPDRQPPQRVWLPSRTRIAMDEAFIYGREAVSDCVRQYNYRPKPYETLKAGAL